MQPAIHHQPSFYHPEPVATFRNTLDITHGRVVTKRNILNISPATKRNQMTILPATVCNIPELKRTKPPFMKEPINHKALEMNTYPKRQNSFFTTPPKPVTKRNKKEPLRTNSHVLPPSERSGRAGLGGDRGATCTAQKTQNLATLRQHLSHACEKNTKSGNPLATLL